LILPTAVSKIYLQIGGEQRFPRQSSIFSKITASNQKCELNNLMEQGSVGNILEFGFDYEITVTLPSSDPDKSVSPLERNYVEFQTLVS
jgi:hypothetical protein